ncbi:MAG: bifunctional riboflavin kinase/FAD synthetase, partial [Nevskiales bacterium]
QALLGELRRHATRLKLPATAMVFEPTPRDFLDPAGAPARLSSLREKLEDLRSSGLDRAFCLHFNAPLARMSATDFLDELLVQRLGAKVIAVGDDFRFGAERKGDFAFLQARGAQHGMQAIRLMQIQIDDERVSSTAIRTRLTAGDVAGAARMLGRPYRISGRALRGQGLGNKLDMPTANLAVRRKPAPTFGVYAVTVLGLDRGARLGVASLGIRPSVTSEGCWLEVHVFDFAGELYGRRLEVQFQQFLRAEERFASLDELREQMHRDAVAAREFFETNGLSSG